MPATGRAPSLPPWEPYFRPAALPGDNSTSSSRLNNSYNELLRVHSSLKSFLAEIDRRGISIEKAINIRGGGAGASLQKDYNTLERELKNLQSPVSQSQLSEEQKWAVGFTEPVYRRLKDFYRRR